jgi:SAM-dependent methyltransferase
MSNLSETPNHAFDPAVAETFAEGVASAINTGAVAVMLSVGHRTGLFDVLARMPAATSQEIAARAALNERYVREWLAVMVMGRVVVYEPESSRYTLPAEHAACLTRGGDLGNFAVYGQFISNMGLFEDRLLDCFETGEGTVYDEYHRFHEVMAEDSDQSVTAGLFDSILPLAEGIERRLEAGIDVLDAGCGRASALRTLAARYPASRFVGYDLCDDAIAYAQATARREGLANTRFEQRDLTGFDEPNSFDFVTSFDAIHDQKDPQGLLRGLRGALRDGGIYLLQDIGGSAQLEQNFDFPLSAFLYAISLFHCTPVSIGQGGEGLGTMWGWETAEAMLQEAGFKDVRRHCLAHDPMNVWFVARV